MKIAILGIKTYPAYFGADRVVENLLKFYDSKNDYYLYLTTVDNKVFFNSKNNLHFIYIPTINNKYLKAPIFFFLSALHVIVAGKYDIIHIHNSDFGIFTLLLRLQKARIVGTFHGHAYLRDKWGKIAKFLLKVSEKFFIWFCHQLTTVSRSTITRMNNKLNPQKIKYIPNGIEKELIIETGRTLEFFGLNDKEYLLFAAGRIDKTKGLHTLIKAFRNLEKKIKLLVIGDFTHDIYYSTKVMKEAEKDKRIFLIKELLSKEELLYVMKYSKAFIFPSEVEAMSMILLEAISLGIPVICSDIEENIDIVGCDYKYLFKSGDADSLREKLIDILSHTIDYEYFNNLSESVLRKFNWETITKEYEILYENLIKERKNNANSISRFKNSISIH